MPDTKITALTAITTVDPAVDVLPIVDVSDTTMAASGTTKKITSNQILGAGGTATLASATITGDLTVDTSTLKVDSVNNRVSFGIATPNRNVVVYAAASPVLQICDATTGTTANDGLLITQAGVDTFIENAEIGGMNFRTSAVTRYQIDSTGISTWSVAGSTAMTLNSTGLGLGGVPSGVNRFAVWNGATQAMTLDTSGNLLVGTTDATQTSGVGTKIIGSGLGPYVVNAATTNSALAYTMYSTGAAAYRFYVGWAGTVFATNTTISAISDARLKENVQDIDVGLGAILALKPRKFDWKAGKGKDIKGDRGFIAQEFEQVFPNLIDEWKDAAPEGEAPYKSVRQDLIPVLVKAIQELAAEVNALKNA